MIVTDLDRLDQEVRPAPAMAKAIEFLAGGAWRQAPDGRMEIDGDQVFAVVQSYETRQAGPEVTFEAHRKYVDVQYVCDGEEVIHYVDTAQVVVHTPYDPARDAMLGTAPGSPHSLAYLPAGRVAVLYPSDAHAAMFAAAAPMRVRKVVVKVAVPA